MSGSKEFGPTKDFPQLSQPSGKPMAPRLDSGAASFLELNDTFANYLGLAGKYLVVNGTETGIISADAITSFLTLPDTPNAFAGLAGMAMVVNAAEDALEATGVPVYVGDAIDMNFQSISNHLLEILAADPIAPLEAQIWYNSTDLKPRVMTDQVRDLIADDDNFHSLLLFPFLSTHEIPVYDTVAGAYGRMDINDIEHNDSFATITPDSGDALVATDEDSFTLQGDGVLGTFVGSLVPNVMTHTLANQNINTFFAGPSIGGAAKPTFRAILDVDMPSSYNPAIWNTLLITPLNTLVPYSGAAEAVDLGAQVLSTTGRITAGYFTEVNTPVDATDAATKGYVDLMVALGIIWVAPVEDIVTALPGGAIVAGLRYILDGDKKIYTADGLGGWDVPAATVAGTTAYVRADTAVIANEIGPYNFNGTDWVYIGAGGRHNDLTNMQGGVGGEYYHLTSAQHVIATQAATAALPGYLTAADWTLFDSKADGNHAHSDGILDWNAGGSGFYTPYLVKAAGKFDSGVVAPDNVDRLNYDGYFYATRLYEGATRVSLDGHTHAESVITFTDILDNNASITKHGFLPKLPNDATKFLNGLGAWAVPAGGGGSSLWSRTGTVLSTLTAGDKVAIGGTDPLTHMLHITGTGYCTGAFTVNSDVRNKNVIDVLDPVLEDLMKVLTIRYTRLDDENKIEYTGYSAQNLNSLFPTIGQHYENDDHYEVDPMGMNAVNTKGIQDLYCLVKMQAEKISALEEKLRLVE